MEPKVSQKLFQSISIMTEVSPILSQPIPRSEAMKGTTATAGRVKHVHIGKEDFGTLN
jgi:hypothetical protein